MIIMLPIPMFFSFLMTAAGVSSYHNGGVCLVLFGMGILQHCSIAVVLSLTLFMVEGFVIVLSPLSLNLRIYSMEKWFNNRLLTDSPKTKRPQRCELVLCHLIIAAP